MLIEIPATAPIGSAYTLSAPNKNFATYLPSSEITITVVPSTVTKNPTKVTATSTVTAKGPLHDIAGSDLEFPIESIKPFSFEISYDVYPEATSASLTLYTDTGIIEASDPSVIDPEAVYICEKDGSESTKNSSKSRRSIDVLPTVFNLSLGRWMEPGTEVRVCAEVVYFNGTKVLGTERYMSVITARE